MGGATCSRAALSRATVVSVPPAGRPLLGGPAPEPGLVHLGVGAFHRAHQAVYTERAMALAAEPVWGIAEVAPRSREVVEALRRQDGLYTVLERRAGTASARVVNAVSEALHAPTASARVLARLAAPGTAVVTMTITEKGYPVDRRTGELADDDAVRADVDAVVAGRFPSGALALLVAGLCRRAEGSGAPLTVLSCDNLTGNGRLLSALVTQFLARLPPALGGPVAAWVAGSVRFPSSMVDRIVPATTAADTAAVAAAIGLTDGAAVIAEPFSQWVIEDDFAGPRPAWELAGAELVADVAVHETAKLRVLNAAHSMLAYLGALAGHATIADAVRDPDLEVAVRAFHREVLGTIDAPPGWDLAEYADSVLHRFANPALGHRCDQVAADGSRKLPVRVVPTLLATRARGRLSSMGALVVAAWVRFVVAGHDDDRRALRVDDPAREAAREAARGAAAADLVRAVLARTGVLAADLAADDEFVAVLAEQYRDLVRYGARHTCRRWSG